MKKKWEMFRFKAEALGIAWLSVLGVFEIGRWLIPESWQNEPVSREEMATFVLVGTWIAWICVMGLHIRIRRLEKGDSANDDL